MVDNKAGKYDNNNSYLSMYKRWLITKQENIILITPISLCKRDGW